MNGNGPKRALLAEDDDDMRALLARTLERGGYGVESANNGRDAWELCAHRDHELLVLDVRMPERSGLDVLMQLRREGVYVPVVLISGFADGIEDLSSDYGAVVLAKPFSVEALWDAVERASDAAASAFLSCAEPLQSTG